MNLKHSGYKMHHPWRSSFKHSRCCPLPRPQASLLVLARCAWGCGTVAGEKRHIKPRAPCFPARFPARNGAWGRGSAVLERQDAPHISQDRWMPVMMNICNQMLIYGKKITLTSITPLVLISSESLLKLRLMHIAKYTSYSRRVLTSCVKRLSFANPAIIQRKQRNQTKPTRALLLLLSMLPALILRSH